MLVLFIIFFFFLYCLCEVFKTTYSEKKNLKLKIKSKKIYNKPFVFLKTIFIIIDFVLLIIHRLSPEGIVERSSPLKTSFLTYIVLISIIIFSVYECVRAGKNLSPRLFCKEE